MELFFAKHLDVISPQFENNAKELSNAGYDMFVPKFDDNFLLNFKKANSKESKNKMLVSYKTKAYDINGYRPEVFTYSNDQFLNPVCVVYHSLTDDKTSFIRMYKNITIPNGVQFLFPENYYGELCTRSSNFPLDIELVIGYIDNSYTFGSGFQVKKLQNEYVDIHENEKLAQLILKKFRKPEPKELKLEEFDSLEEVIYRRQLRNGGVGSTGRF